MIWLNLQHKNRLIRSCIFINLNCATIVKRKLSILISLENCFHVPKAHHSTCVKLQIVSLNFIPSPTSMRLILQIIILFLGIKALFTLNVCVCICVKLQEWVPWKQMMMFILNVCLWQQRSKKNANADVKCEQGLKDKALLFTCQCILIGKWKWQQEQTKGLQHTQQN